MPNDEGEGLFLELEWDQDEEHRCETELEAKMSREIRRYYAKRLSVYGVEFRTKQVASDPGCPVQFNTAMFQYNPFPLRNFSL